MNLPVGDLPTMAVQSMSDDDLRRAERDFTAVAGHLSAIAGRCAQRAKAVASVIAKRENARKQGREITPAPSREGAGAMHLTRAPGEKATFTDHAVLRWLERTRGIDLDQVRAAMSTAYDAGEPIAGGGIVVSGDNCFVRTSTGLVKTMMPLDWLREKDIQIADSTYGGDDK